MDTQISKAWKIAANIGYALVILLLPFSPARGDAVADWNAIAARMASSSEQSRAAQELSDVYAVIFETMNFVEGKYVPYFFFSSRRRHTRLTCDWSSDVCSSD